MPAELVDQCSKFDPADRCGFAHVVEQLSSPETRREATRMPFATRMPGPALQRTQAAAARADAGSEITPASEAGSSSLHEKTLPKPGEAVHAAGAQTPASMLSAVAKLGATSVLTQTADDRQTKLERKKSTLYGFHAHTEHTKGRAGRVSFAGRRSSAGAALQEAALSHNCSAAPSGIGRMPAAPALPAVSFAKRLLVRTRRSQGATGRSTFGDGDAVTV